MSRQAKLAIWPIKSGTLKKRKINIKKRKTSSGEDSGACFVHEPVATFAV